MKTGTKIGFGIEGEWLSEYVPGSDCKYYFVEEGVKKPGKDQSASDEPRSGIYPLISVLGEDFGAVKLPSLIKPPQVKLTLRPFSFLFFKYLCQI